MKRAALFTWLIALSVAITACAEPVKLIYDTDMGNDVDDALALAVIHALQNRGEVELLAVTITKDHEEVAPYIDAVNTFYGRGDIPIGITSSGVTPAKSKFTGVAQEKVDGEFVYPHDLKLGDPVPDAVDILRKTLAAQPDGSVVIAQVGFSTNLADLLKSESGAELAAKKVKHISIMAGAFEPINGKTHREYNVVMDIPAAQKLAAEWPTPIIYSGFEIGLAILYPAASIEQDFRYVARHPMPESYQAYLPTPHERPTWDLTSVLWAVREDRGYFDISESGTVSVDEQGVTTFAADPKGKHRYLKLNADTVARVRENFSVLASEPPQR